MPIYLPIAEQSVDLFLLLGLGGAVGFLSGLFGVGGGFLVTPMLIFIGIPPAVAVASSANQLVATSVAGVYTHWRRGTIDLRMGTVLLCGGVLGSGLGVMVMAQLRRVGQIDLVISLIYVIFLGGIGGMMLVEAMRTLLRRRRGGGRGRLHHHNMLHRLPLKMRFPKSRLYISALLPGTLGFLIGMLSALMGTGGGFIMIPAMIYLLGMPTAAVAGTSLFQILFVGATATFLQATQTQTVDATLALILTAGSVVALQWGARVGARLRAEQFRILLALLVLGVAVKMLFDLVVTPQDPFSIRSVHAV